MRVLTLESMLEEIGVGLKPIKALYQRSTKSVKIGDFANLKKKFQRWLLIMNYQSWFQMSNMPLVEMDHTRSRFMETNKQMLLSLQWRIKILLEEKPFKLSLHMRESTKFKESFLRQLILKIKLLLVTWSNSKFPFIFILLFVTDSYKKMMFKWIYQSLIPMFLENTNYPSNQITIQEETMNNQLWCNWLVYPQKTQMIEILKQLDQIKP